MVPSQVDLCEVRLVATAQCVCERVRAAALSGGVDEVVREAQLRQPTRAWVRVRVRVKVTGLEDKVESHVGSLVPWRKL